MNTIKAIFKLARQTKGALKYDEVDDNHMPLDMREGKIGQIYLRKSNFPDGVYPDTINVIVEQLP